MTTRTPSHPASDREALSALFDGELVGDAARFALKRLDHDQDWRATCERWQCVGDVLRNRNAPLPATFPSRLRAAMRAGALHAGNTREAAPAVANARAGGMRWGTVALAASAAVVAFFLARSPIGGSDAPAPQQVASGTATPPAATATPSPATQAPDAPAIDLETATAAVAVAAVARPAQRNRNLQRDRAATDRIVSSVVAARSPVSADAGPMVQPVADEIAMNGDVAGEREIQGAETSPFTGTAAAEVRPWPRAVLPQYGSGGALAADFATAPSFYPFVPAPESQPANDTRSAPGAGPAPMPSSNAASTNPQSPPSPSP